MKTLLLHWLLLFMPVFCFTQGWNPVGTRSASMANASIGNEDIWAYHHNPGALGFVTQGGAGITYQDRFLLRELQIQALTVVCPLQKGVFSAGVQNQGYTSFKAYRAGMGYSMKLAENLAAGIQLNYQGIRLTDYYGSKNTVTAAFGLLAKVGESWKFGFSVFNLGRAKLSEFQDDRLTTVMRLGATYIISDKLFFTAEAAKNVDYPVQFKGGMEYEAFDHFFLRAGIANNPIEVCFGFGYRWKKISFDAGSAYHQVLGWSPSFAFNYFFDA